MRSRAMGDQCTRALRFPFRALPPAAANGQWERKLLLRWHHGFAPRAKSYAASLRLPPYAHLILEAVLSVSLSRAVQGFASPCARSTRCRVGWQRCPKPIAPATVALVERGTDGHFTSAGRCTCARRQKIVPAQSRNRTEGRKRRRFATFRTRAVRTWLGRFDRARAASRPAEAIRQERRAPRSRRAKADEKKSMPHSP